MVRSRLRLILIGLRYLKMIDNLIDYILAIAGGRREEPGTTSLDLPGAQEPKAAGSRGVGQ